MITAYINGRNIYYNRIKVLEATHTATKKLLPERTKEIKGIKNN